MKLQFRLEVSPQERLRAKERVLGRRVLPLSSSSASLSRRPHVTSATLRDLMGTAAISHGAAPQRTKALCRSGEVPPGTLSLRAFPQRFLAPRLRHSWPLDSGQYSSCPAVASYFQWGTLQEPGELLPLFFWALRPFSGEEQGMSNLMRVHTTDRT